MTKTIGLIAVRMKSSRLKKKALLDLGGKPLIVRLYDRVRQSKRMDDVVLCTSDDSQDNPLETIAVENNIPFIRGDKDDVLKRFLNCLGTHPAKNIVRITGDNPLCDPEVIDLLIESHEKKNADYSRMDGVPMGVTAEVISVNALKYIYKMAEDTKSSEYMTWYFTKNDAFQLNVLQAPQELNRPALRLTVDYQEDIELLLKIYEKFNFDNSPPALNEIIDFLDANPELAKTNLNVKEQPVPPEINTRLKQS